MTKSAKEMGIMQGFPPPADKMPTHMNWDLAPYNRWTFQNVRNCVPTAPIYRGEGPVRLMPAATRDLDSLPVAGVEGEETTLLKLLQDTYADGFAVLHRGKLVYERYLNGMTPRTLHLSQSVGKSFVSTLIGILWSRGLVDLNKPVQHYVPELANCGYRDALLWQVLDMRSGVKFDESDYANVNSELGQMDRAVGWKPPLRSEDPTNTPELILSMKLERPHGGDFVYRSIETEVLGWIVACVTGEPLVDFMGRELWAPMGAAHDANFTVCRANFPLASGGLNAALMDYARFGQLFLEEGSVGGKQIVSPAWVAQCSQGDVAAFRARLENRFEDCPDAAYSRQWWALAPKRRRQVGLGIFGQMLWIDPVDELVVAKLSSWPDYLMDTFSLATRKACETIGQALNA